MQAGATIGVVKTGTNIVALTLIAIAAGSCAEEERTECETSGFPKTYIESRPDLVRFVERADGMALLARAAYTIGVYDLDAGGNLSTRYAWQDALSLGAAIGPVVFVDVTEVSGQWRYRLVTDTDVVLLTEGEDAVVVEPLTWADAAADDSLKLLGASRSRDGTIHVLWRSPGAADADVVSYGVGTLETDALVRPLGPPFFVGADPPQFVMGAQDEETGRIFVDVHGANQVHVLDAAGDLVETVETETRPYFLDWMQLPDGLFFGHHNIFVAAFDPLDRSNVELTREEVGETGTVPARSMLLDQGGVLWIAAPAPDGVGVRAWRDANCREPSPACSPDFSPEVVTDVKLGFCDIVLTLR